MVKDVWPYLTVGLLLTVLFAAAALAFVYGAFEIGLKAQLFEGIVFGDR